MGHPTTRTGQGIKAITQHHSTILESVQICTIYAIFSLTTLQVPSPESKESKTKAILRGGPKLGEERRILIDWGRSGREAIDQQEGGGVNRLAEANRLD